jgi:uncharacterized protein YqgC (DUF456 family)
MAAWADGFARVGVATIVVLGLVAAFSYTVDFVMMSLGLRHLGASRRAIGGAALGTIAGLFLGLPGLILGPFVGAVAGELTVERDIARAGRAGVGAWVGFLLGTVAKVGLAFTMVGIFVAAWFLF